MRPIRAGFAALTLVTCPMSARAADYDRSYAPTAHHHRVVVTAHGYARHGYARGAYAAGAVLVAPGPYVVAPPAIRLVVPPTGPRPGLAYAPPPVYPAPPPLIAAVPVIGPYLVPVPLGPPPATVLDAYDHRFDYNQ